MDKELPSEIFAQIASNLSLKDLNSLLRISKSAHWKLQKHRSILTKAKVAINIIRDAKFPQVFDFDVQQDQKRWKINLGDHVVMPPIKRIRRDEAIVEQFYCNNIDRNSLLDPVEGFALHMQFLLSRAFIETMRVGWLFDSEILEITKAANRNGTKFGTVELYTSHFKQCHQDLLIACNPNKLVIGGECRLPDSFYHLPVIQRPHRLHDSGLNNIDLFTLSATDIEVNKLSNIDFPIIAKYLKQWTENKREIKRIQFKVKIRKIEAALSDLKIVLKRNGVHFSSPELEEDGGFSLKVHRLSDDAILFLNCLEGTVEIIMEP